jgi:hypothetical protein
VKSVKKSTSEMESANESHGKAENGEKRGCSGYQCSGLCYLKIATGDRNKSIQKIRV